MTDNNTNNTNYISPYDESLSIRDWIDVRKFLPEPKWPSTEVLMCNRAGFVYVGYHETGDDWRHLNHVEAGNVIAWMPLPHPVKIGKLDALSVCDTSRNSHQSINNTEYVSEHETHKLELIHTLREMRDVQGMDGSWNYDNYMYGMYNGMEYALAIMEERDPKFRSSPDRWVSKVENDNLDYQKVLSACLLCDPIPAYKREDDTLEPPWEVISRVRQERNDAKIVAIDAIRELNRILDTGDIHTSRIMSQNLEEFLYND